MNPIIVIIQLTFCGSSSWIGRCRALTFRYTAKVKGELKLDEKALSSLRADRQRFLCKAVENYIQCLEEGEEHDTWVFRLASLWLGNAEVKAVNDIVKVDDDFLFPLS